MLGFGHPNSHLNSKSRDRDIAWDDPLVQAILSPETEAILIQRNPDPLTESMVSSEVMKFLETNHPVTAVEPRLSVSQSSRNYNQYQRALNSIEHEMRKELDSYANRRRMGKEQQWFVKDIPGYQKPYYDNVGQTGRWAHYNHKVDTAAVMNLRMDLDNRPVPNLEHTDHSRIAPMTKRNLNSIFGSLPTVLAHDSRDATPAICTAPVPVTIAPEHRFRQFGNREALFVPGGQWIM